MESKHNNGDMDLTGLDIMEFEEALKPMLAAGVSSDQLQTVFQKMDTSDRQVVSWEEFINFAIEVS